MGWNPKKTLKKITNAVLPGVWDAGEKVAEGLKGAWDDFTGKSAIDLQNKYNMEMWEKQNEYNTPANQMKRYFDAGLNPNLIYSQGNAGNASSAPEMKAYQGSFGKIMDLLGSFINMSGQVQNQELQKLQALTNIQHSADVLEFQKHQFAVQQAWRQVQDERWQRDFDERVRHNKAMETAPKGGLYGLLERGLSSFFGKPVTDVLSDSGNFMKNVSPEQVGPQSFGIGNMVKPFFRLMYRQLGTYGRNINLRDKSWR